MGAYGGGAVAFLSLEDLLHSKETERETDWQDIALLEEIQDARLLAAAATGPGGAQQALAKLRSRRGFDRGVRMGLYQDLAAVEQAIAACTHPVAYAYLAPLAPTREAAGLSAPLDSTAAAALRAAPFNSTKHLAVVEIVRRAHKRRARDVDRADKQSKLSQP